MHDAEIVLGDGLALFGSLAEPLRRLNIAPGHPLACEVQNAEIVLGIDVPLFGSLAKPLRRLMIVLRRALTFTVHERQIVLGIAVTLVGSQAIPLQRLTSFCATPRPSSYMPPSLNWARALPWSASSRKSRRAVA